MIVLDTLNAALGDKGVDENTSQGMGLVTSWGKYVIEGCQTVFGVSPGVVIIHHTGKDVNRGPRGIQPSLGH